MGYRSSNAGTRRASQPRTAFRTSHTMARGHCSSGIPSQKWTHHGRKADSTQANTSPMGKAEVLLPALDFVEAAVREFTLDADPCLPAGRPCGVTVQGGAHLVTHRQHEVAMQIDRFRARVL